MKFGTLKVMEGVDISSKRTGEMIEINIPVPEYQRLSCFAEKPKPYVSNTKPFSWDVNDSEDSDDLMMKRRDS
jgi:hypothetical protein